jgi:dTDP-4-dehydrorhamnose 3,5-epimerase
MLTGIVVKPLKRFVDERGFFTEIFRSDWKELLGEDSLQQANFSITYPSTIRAWHRHRKGQVDYFVVISGVIKICIYDENSKELNELISSGENIQVVKIPGHYWHGFKVLGNDPVYLLYFVNKLYNSNRPDELRRSWNDSLIVPKKINGKDDDPRCNKPWDWFYPPFR